MNNVKHICSICNVEFTGWGHNPQPVIDDINARCCDDCNMSVIIARLVEYKERRDKNVL